MDTGNIFISVKAFPGLDCITPDQAVSWYLISSYLYYQLDKCIITDEEFDGLCKIILKRWDVIKHHHKELIDKEALDTGSGFYLRVFPLIVVSTAGGLLRQWEKENKIRGEKG